MRVIPCILLLLGLVARGCTGTDEESRAAGTLRKACSRRGAGKGPPGRINTTQRLIELRKVMLNQVKIRDLAIDAYIITSDDEHQTEYVSEYDRRRQYISGFSGSNGDAIVTHDKAALWTDGRYHLQADDQLNCEWLLMREGQSKVPSKSEWLRQELPKHGRIGADPKLISAAVWNALKFELANSTLKLVPLDQNLIDLIWVNHTDKIEVKDVFVRGLNYSGRNWSEKVEDVRKELKMNGVDAMVVTSLAEIAWLLNIRGRDIPYNPFVRSYVILSMNSVHFYVNQSKLLVNKIERHLWTGSTSNSVIIKNYEDIWLDLPTLTQAWKHVLVPANSIFSMGASQKIYSLVPDNKRISKQSPIIALKAKKNPQEIIGMERAHVRDAVAMCEFLEYLERRFEEGDKEWYEMEVASLINDFRFEQKESLGNSFETIVAFGQNGALPHYEPTISTNSRIFDNSTLVIDSGGQYNDGTTDVTRTLHFGQPTVEQTNAYTRVLMGTIQLSSLKFPSNLKMSAADVMARAPLWEVGLDYLHGTGHGIGSFLGVHEPPIHLHYNSHNRHQYFKPGYFFSNEPGYYSEGDFGVRLENILEVIPVPWFKHISGQSFLAFKDVTLVPYEPKLINISLLGVQHRRWLNEYNTKIRTLVGEELKLQNKMQAFYWMMEKTKHIPGTGSLISRPSLYLFIITIVVSFC